MSDQKNHPQPYTGIFVAYFSAQHGTTLGIVVLRENDFVGADVGGATYDGMFTVVEDRRAVGKVTITAREGGTLITGASSDLPVSFETPIELDLPLDAKQFHRINTKTGPINVRFEKVKDI